VTSQGGTLKTSVNRLFLHDLYFSDLDCISAVPEPDVAFSLFTDVFNTIVDNHAPFKK
jgi:hypothetical protein